MASQEVSKIEHRTDQQKIESAIEIAVLGVHDGAHHKMWVIDQMVRALTDIDGPEYRWFVTHRTGSWDEGIAP